jgi:hypothetical protein
VAEALPRLALIGRLHVTELVVAKLGDQGVLVKAVCAWAGLLPGGTCFSVLLARMELPALGNERCVFLGFIPRRGIRDIDPGEREGWGDGGLFSGRDA